MCCLVRTRGATAVFTSRRFDAGDNPAGVLRASGGTLQVQPPRQQDVAVIFAWFLCAAAGDRGEDVAAYPGEPARGAWGGLRASRSPCMGGQAQLGQARVGTPHSGDGHQEGEFYNFTMAATPILLWSIEYRVMMY